MRQFVSGRNREQGMYLLAMQELWRQVSRPSAGNPLRQGPDLTPLEVILVFEFLRKHDRATAEHSLRVQRYALQLAQKLGLNLDVQARVATAAVFHDLGKLAIGRQTLNKPGVLTPDERQRVQIHPLESERLARAHTDDWQILAAIRGHHERFDGTGYPDGLRGYAIPLLARILAVADCFDALTSERPYRPAYSTNQGILQLQGQAGKQFDPELVAAFIQSTENSARASTTFCCVENLI